MRVSNSDFRPPVHALYFNYLTFTHSSLMQFLVFITLAGTPATIECEGTSFTTHSICANNNIITYCDFSYHLSASLNSNIISNIGAVSLITKTNSYLLVNPTIASYMFAGNYC